MQKMTEQESKKKTLFFTMVDHPAKGWTRVGNAYPSSKSATEWLPFVSGSWRGLRTKISQCTVRFKDGKLTEKSREILDKKFNLEAQ